MLCIICQNLACGGPTASRLQSVPHWATRKAHCQHRFDVRVALISPLSRQPASASRSAWRQAHLISHSELALLSRQCVCCNSKRRSSKMFRGASQSSACVLSPLLPCPAGSRGIPTCSPSSLAALTLVQRTRSCASTPSFWLAGALPCAWPHMPWTPCRSTASDHPHPDNRACG